jgi:hypothetical protein
MQDTIVKNNYFTQPDSRPPKSADKGEIDDILSKYESKLHLTQTADIAGAKIQLKTDSNHVFDWWNLNWFLSNGKPDGTVYVIKDVEGVEPHLFYNLNERKTLITNSEYYGAAKSAGALGLSGKILEERGGYPIHGACIGFEKNGKIESAIMIAPTGTGKTTQSHELTYSVRNSKVHSDDYVFVFFNDEPKAIATERQLYMRTDIAEEHPTFIHLFNDLPIENVVTEKEKCRQMGREIGPCYRKVFDGERKCVFDEGGDKCHWSYANSRVMFPRHMFPMQTRDERGYLHEVPKGEENVINEAIVKNVFLLTRNDFSEPAQKLEEEEAIEVLKKGQFIIRPGAGPEEKWNTNGFEPFYDPYPPELNHKRQEEFYRRLFDENVFFYLLNTGSHKGIKITPHQTHTYIRRIIEI